MRDEVLPELGVRLEDQIGQTCIKLEDPEKLKMEQQQKRKLIEAKIAVSYLFS
jgi:hypothetical protein